MATTQLFIPGFLAANALSALQLLRIEVLEWNQRVSIHSLTHTNAVTGLEKIPFCIFFLRLSLGAFALFTSSRYALRKSAPTCFHQARHDAAPQH
jgi:hypothetical protein